MCNSKFKNGVYLYQKVADQTLKSLPSTKEQKRNENGIRIFEYSDFLFFYSINILSFVNSKSSTLKSGAKWLNFKTKF